MKAKRFVELIERAFHHEYDDETSFDTVPYIHDDQGPMTRCLGVFLLPDQKMAVVAARVQTIIYSDDLAQDQMDGQAAEFVWIMHSMLVSPYMQWHCAYFPGLTQEQVDGDCEAFEDPEPGDRPASEVLGGPPPRRLTPEELFSWLEHAGGDVRRYSGRGMMGAECPSVSGDLAACRSAIAGALTCMRPDVGDEAFDDAAERLLQFHSDQLGTGVVLYWPGETLFNPTAEES